MDKQTFLGLVQQRKSKGIDYYKSLCVCEPITGCCQFKYKEWCSINISPTDSVLPDIHFVFYRIDGSGRATQSGDRGIIIGYSPIGTIPCTKNPPDSINCFDFGTFDGCGYVIQGYTEIDDDVALEAINKLPEKSDIALILSIGLIGVIGLYLLTKKR